MGEARTDDPDTQAVARMFASFHKERMSEAVIRKWSDWIRHGQKTASDLVRQLQQEQEQYHELRKAFQQLYGELVGDHQCDRAFAEMWRSLERVCVEDMRGYIAECPAFTVRYRDLIAKMHLTIVNRAISTEVLQQYLQKFVQQPDYTIDKLCGELQQCAREAPAVIDASEPVEPVEPVDDSSSWVAAYKNEADPVDCVQPEYYYATLSKLQRLAADHGDATAAVQLLRGLLSPDVHQTAAVFRQVLGRGMTVVELCKYLPNVLRTQGEGATTRAAMEQLRDFHCTNLARARELFRKFLQAECSQDEFLHNILPQLSLDDDPHNTDLFQQLRARLVTGDERYRQAMERRLQHTSRTLHDVELQGPDLEYVFRQAQTAQLDLEDDAIRDLIIGVRHETHALTDRICAVYAEVLERTPDDWELQNCLTLYRGDGDKESGFQGMDEVLTQRLLRGLEYHDVIKRRLQEAFKQHYDGAVAPPSWLYSALHMVLQGGPCCVEDVDDAIAAVTRDFGSRVTQCGTIKALLSAANAIPATAAAAATGLTTD
jgi:hypothetical protein